MKMMWNFVKHVSTRYLFIPQVLRCIDDEGDFCQRRELLEMCELALIRDWRYMKGWAADLDMALRLAQ